MADLLRGDYKQSDYGKVILPMTVLRRLDCVLEPKKQVVLDYLPKVQTLKESAMDIALNRIAGLNFHKRSQFNFDKLIVHPAWMVGEVISPQVFTSQTFKPTPKDQVLLSVYNGEVFEAYWTISI